MPRKEVGRLDPWVSGAIKAAMADAVTSLERAEAGLVEAAKALVEEFQQARKELKAQEHQRMGEEARAAGRESPPPPFAPLSLFARTRANKRTRELRLIWQLVTFAKNSEAPTPFFTYLTMDDPGGYSLRRLEPKARDWEKELVRETEIRARGIRLAWTRLKHARASLQSFDDALG